MLVLWFFVKFSDLIGKTNHVCVLLLVGCACRLVIIELMIFIFYNGYHYCYSYVWLEKLFCKNFGIQVLIL